MKINVAYLHNSISVVKDTTKPLLVTSCGYYLVKEGPVIKTNRPKGRRDYQLIYIAEGRGHFFFKDGTRIVNKGEMILFRPYEPQSYYYYPQDQCEAYWVHFTGGSVEEVLEHYRIPHDDCIFSAGSYPEYVHLYEEMIRELQLCRKGYLELLPIFLRQLFLYIDRHRGEGKRTGSAVISEVEQAARYFNEHYNRDISIDEYAASVHMSTCWFIRRFKQVLKVTPMQYILSLRITNAKELLETKEMSVKEIAHEVGFSNPLYFSRIFTKTVGLSPTEYREKHAES